MSGVFGERLADRFSARTDTSELATLPSVRQVSAASKISDLRVRLVSLRESCLLQTLLATPTYLLAL